MADGKDDWSCAELGRGRRTTVLVVGPRGMGGFVKTLRVNACL